jgi:glycosyltransferase involved in cell wall biosynthesis
MQESESFKSAKSIEQPLNKKLISIILPVYNEEKNIVLICQKLSSILIKLILEYDYEIIIINDGSNDHSWQEIKKLAAEDKKIKAVNFSRNFGHQIAIAAGYDLASGDAIITMDADLQHPPEILPHMINSWKQGTEIVYIKSNEGHNGFLKRITSVLYYKILDSISSVKIPRNIQDFRLIDKKVLKTIKQSKEKSPYWRGLVAWTGFKHIILETQYAKRIAGKTGYSWKKMFKLAFDGVTGFSLFPLKIAGFAGFFVIITGTLMFGYITIDAFVFKIYYPLFKWLVTIIYIFMGVQFLLFWLIGEYIGRMFEQQKNRPLYIIDEMINRENE